MSPSSPVSGYKEHVSPIPRRVPVHWCRCRFRPFIGDRNRAASLQPTNSTFNRPNQIIIISHVFEYLFIQLYVQRGSKLDSMYLWIFTGGLPQDTQIMCLKKKHLVARIPSCLLLKLFRAFIQSSINVIQSYAAKLIWKQEQRWHWHLAQRMKISTRAFTLDCGLSKFISYKLIPLIY